MAVTAFDIDRFTALSSRTFPYTAAWAYNGQYDYSYVQMQTDFFLPALAQYNIQTGDKIFINYVTDPFDYGSFRHLGPTFSMSGTFILNDGVLTISWDNVQCLQALVPDLSQDGTAVQFAPAPIGVFINFTAAIIGTGSTGVATLTLNPNGSTVQSGGVIAIAGTDAPYTLYTAPITVVGLSDGSYGQTAAVTSIVITGDYASAVSAACALYVVTPSLVSFAIA